MTKLSLLRDIYLSLKGIYFYRFKFSKSQFWSNQEMEIYQYKMIRKLLTESYANVPYYTDLFNKIKFNPIRDFNTLSDLSRIPVLSKKVAKENRDKLINPNYVNFSFPLRTSGSTGEPFEVHVTYDAWAVEQAMVWRHWSWGGYKLRDQMAIVRSYSPKLGEPLIKHDSIRNFTYYSPFHLNDEKLSIYLNDMIQRHTKVLRGYPSSIFTLAEFVNRTKTEIPELKMILTASEVLSDLERSFIENVFKTEVSNHYGLAEVCVMMGDCEKHQGLHNYDDYGYLELLPTGEGSQLSVVGTNLHNLAMPLIRYETGDLAELTEKPCSCSRTFQTIKNISGRKDTCIKTPENYKIPTVNFYTMFEGMLKIKKWQIIQREINTIEVIVHSDEAPESFLPELEAALRQRIPTSMHINIKINKQFVRVNEGKLNTFLTFLR